MFRAKQRREQVRLVSIAAAVLLALYGVLWLLDSDNSPFQKGRPPTPVAVMAISEGVFPVVVDGLGTVTSRRTVTIRTQVDGRLDQVLFQEGQLVKEGDVLAIVDPRPYEAKVMEAQGKLEQDKALLRDARLILKRYEILFKQDSIARQDLDTQTAKVTQYEGLISTDQGILDAAKVQLSFTKIVAPFDGRLGLRLVDAGNVVKAGESSGIVTITQIRPIDVLFTIPAEKLPPILTRFNEGKEMVVSAYDRNFKTVLATGVLKSIDNQIDPNTGMIKLKAEFVNDDNSLYPNQFVNAQLLIENRENAVLAPANAILRGAQGTYVYTVDAENTVAARTIKLGGVNGQVAEVLEGLTVGETVVTDGFDKLRPGAKVVIPKAAGR
ncbi:MAG: efflux RND transporter periplasmic adaptor subunit [Rhodocyclaceae bacterium]|nr:efflux RND transporter periplasmic adaptor subunit [Rhodocyclaceae bacterium]